MMAQEDTCVHGHNDWKLTPRENGRRRRRCAECEREWQRKRYQLLDDGRRATQPGPRPESWHNTQPRPEWARFLYYTTIEFVNDLVALGAASLGQICDWTGWGYHRARRTLYRLRRREIVRRTRSGLWVVADHIEPSPEPWNESAGYQEGT